MRWEQINNFLNAPALILFLILCFRLRIESTLSYRKFRVILCWFGWLLTPLACALLPNDACSIFIYFIKRTFVTCVFALHALNFWFIRISLSRSLALIHMVSFCSCNTAAAYVKYLRHLTFHVLPLVCCSTWRILILLRIYHYAYDDVRVFDAIETVNKYEYKIHAYHGMANS